MEKKKWNKKEETLSDFIRRRYPNLPLYVSVIALLISLIKDFCDKF